MLAVLGKMIASHAMKSETYNVGKNLLKNRVDSMIDNKLNQKFKERLKPTPQKNQNVDLSKLTYTKLKESNTNAHNSVMGRLNRNSDFEFRSLRLLDRIADNTDLLLKGKKEKKKNGLLGTLLGLGMLLAPLLKKLFKPFTKVLGHNGGLLKKVAYGIGILGSAFLLKKGIFGKLTGLVSKITPNFIKNGIKDSLVKTGGFLSRMIPSSVKSIKSNAIKTGGLISKIIPESVKSNAIKTGGFLSKIIPSGVKTGAVALAAKIGSKKVAESATKVGSKKVAESATKIGATSLLKGGAKLGGKLIPGLGLAMGIGFGAKRAMNGDYTGAGLELLSGLASTIPGIGTATSLAIQGGLIARDIHRDVQNKTKQAVTDTTNGIKNLNATNEKLSTNHLSLSEKLSNGVSSLVTNSVNGLKKATGTITDNFGKYVPKILLGLGTGVTSIIMTTGKSLVNVTSTLGNGLTNIATALGTSATSIMSSLSNGVSNVVSFLSKNISSAISNISSVIGNAIGGGGNQNSGGGFFDNLGNAWDKLSGNQSKKQMMVYQAYRNAGMSDKQARAITAEVGRENSYNSDKLFGTHIDPKNGAVNIGMLSWQGARGQKLYQYMSSKGLIKNGRMVQTQEALDAQAQYVIREMQSGQYNRTKSGFLDNKNVSYQQAVEILGNDYIKWRYNDPNYSQGHKNRNSFYNALNKQLGTTPSDDKNNGFNKLVSSVDKATSNVKSNKNNVSSKSGRGVGDESEGLGNSTPLNKGANSNLAKIGLRSFTGKSLDGLVPEFKNKLLEMFGEYNQRTGKKIRVSSAYRSSQQQQALYNSKPKGVAAPPGRSMHEYGLAVDIDRGDVSVLIQLGLLDKYGFWQAAYNPNKPRNKDEYWHIEHRSIGQDVKKRVQGGSSSASDSQSSNINGMVSGGIETAAKTFGEIATGIFGDENIQKMRDFLRTGNEKYVAPDRPETVIGFKGIKSKEGNNNSNKFGLINSNGSKNNYSLFKNGSIERQTSDTTGVKSTNGFLLNGDRQLGDTTGVKNSGGFLGNDDRQLGDTTGVKNSGGFLGNSDRQGKTKKRSWWNKLFGEYNLGSILGQIFPQITQIINSDGTFNKEGAINTILSNIGISGISGIVDTNGKINKESIINTVLGNISKGIYNTNNSETSNNGSYSTNGIYNTNGLYNTSTILGDNTNGIYNTNNSETSNNGLYSTNGIYNTNGLYSTNGIYNTNNSESNGLYNTDNNTNILEGNNNSNILGGIQNNNKENIFSTILGSISTSGILGDVKNINKKNIINNILGSISTSGILGNTNNTGIYNRNNILGNTNNTGIYNNSNNVLDDEYNNSNDNIEGDINNILGGIDNTKENNITNFLGGISSNGILSNRNTYNSSYDDYSLEGIKGNILENSQLNVMRNNGMDSSSYQVTPNIKTNSALDIISDINQDNKIKMTNRDALQSIIMQPNSPMTIGRNGNGNPDGVNLPINVRSNESLIKEIALEYLRNSL